MVSIALLMLCESTAEADASEAEFLAARNSSDGSGMHVRYPWESAYAPWRRRDSVDVATWIQGIEPPVPRDHEGGTWDARPLEEREGLFRECLLRQTRRFTARVPAYAPPKLSEMTALVRTLLSERRAKVVVAVFWGRRRCVAWRR